MAFIFKILRLKLAKVSRLLYVCVSKEANYFTFEKARKMKKYDIRAISNSIQASAQNLEIEMLNMHQLVLDLRAENGRLTNKLEECQAAKVMHRNNAKKSKKYAEHLKAKLIEFK